MTKSERDLLEAAEAYCKATAEGVKAENFKRRLLRAWSAKVRQPREKAA